MVQTREQRSQIKNKRFARLNKCLQKKRVELVLGKLWFIRMLLKQWLFFEIWKYSGIKKLNIILKI